MTIKPSLYLMKKASEHSDYVYRLYKTHYNKRPDKHDSKWVWQNIYYTAHYIQAQRDYSEMFRRLYE